MHQNKDWQTDKPSKWVNHVCDTCWLLLWLINEVINLDYTWIFYFSTCQRGKVKVNRRLLALTTCEQKLLHFFPQETVSALQHCRAPGNNLPSPWPFFWFHALRNSEGWLFQRRKKLLHQVLYKGKLMPFKWTITNGVDMLLGKMNEVLLQSQSSSNKSLCLSHALIQTAWHSTFFNNKGHIESLYYSNEHSSRPRHIIKVVSQQSDLTKACWVLGYCRWSPTDSKFFFKSCWDKIKSLAINSCAASRESEWKSPL